MHELQDLFCLLAVVAMQGIGVFVGNDGVDEDDVNTVFAQTGYVKEWNEILQTVGIQNLAHQRLGLIEQSRKLANTHFGAILRAHTCVFPNG